MSVGAAVAALAMTAAPLPAVVKKESDGPNTALAFYPLLALPGVEAGNVHQFHYSHSSHSSHLSHVSGSHSSHGSHLSHTSHFSSSVVGPPAPVTSSVEPPPAPKTHPATPKKPAATRRASTSTSRARSTPPKRRTTRSSTPRPVKSSFVMPSPTDLTVSPASHPGSSDDPVGSAIVGFVLLGGVVVVPIYLYRRRRSKRKVRRR